MEYENDRIPTVDELVALYDSVGWGAYTNDPNGLAMGIRNSTLVVTARDNGRLVGLARVLSDDVPIVYVQDVLVNPEHRGTALGESSCSSG